MRSLILVALLAAAIASPLREVAQLRGDDEDWGSFIKFTHDYTRSYDTVAEVNMRFDNFKNSLVTAAQLMLDNPLAQFGVNKFADMSPEEFRSKYLMPVNITEKLRPKNLPVWTPTSNVKMTAASNIDWCDSTHNLCTPVKDQGQCGSCWAFSATETIESANAKAGKGLNTLAPEQIVDCDTNDGGCGGGDPRSGMSYVQSVGGQEGESNYPYTAGQNGQAGSCQANAQKFIESDKGGPMVVSNGVESKLQSFLLSTGPPSVCVDASSWQTYQGGVMTKCGCNIDHAVQATGIATISGKQAYIVRNSWAADWGVNGFIYLATGSNTCCVANEVSWANV